MVESKCYFSLKKKVIQVEDVLLIGENGLTLALGKKKDILTFLNVNNSKDYYFETNFKNSKIPLADYSLYDERITLFLHLVEYSSFFNAFLN